MAPFGFASDCAFESFPFTAASVGELWPGPSSNVLFVPFVLGAKPVGVTTGFLVVACRFAAGVWKKEAADLFCVVCVELGWLCVPFGGDEVRLASPASLEVPVSRRKDSQPESM